MMKRRFKKLFTGVMICVVMLLQGAVTAFASGGVQSDALAAGKVSTPGEELETVTSQTYILTEMRTGTVLYEKNADKQLYSAHFNKLMTLLLLAQRISSGKIKTTDLFTTTDRANSQGDPQIWLDRDEKISVDELIKAITVGNANDAAVTIAENVCTSEEKFVAEMNAQAKALGMSSTLFKDSTGADKANVTTARDLSKLCAELAKYEFLTPYLKTWLVNVRNSRAELVNSNRLVRTYSGLTGMKACSSKESGSCGCVTAIKSDMQLCAVVLECADNDKRDSDIKKLLKCGAEVYQIYSPQVPKELLQRIPVTGGESLECELEVQGEPLVVIKRGTASEFKQVTEKAEQLKAPVSKGQVCAQLTLEYDKKPVCTVQIVAKREIKKMNWRCGLKKLLYNLIKL